MSKEFLSLMLKKKEIPYYYFLYLHKKDRPNYLEYLSTKEVHTIFYTHSLHRPDLRALLDNKMFFSLFWADKPVNTTVLTSYNIKSSFIYNGTATQVKNEKDLFNFFQTVFADKRISEVFMRPPEEYGGRGCFKLTQKDLESDLTNIYDNIVKGQFVHTLVLQQHKKLNEIRDNSLSTMRIITLITKEGTVEIVNSFMRFGVGNSVVDNASSGGFFVGIDHEMGTLKKTGYYLPDYGGAEIFKHPDNGFTWENFEIPFYKEACEEVIKAVEIVPDRFIGWDVAVTPDGPVIIESNTMPDLRMSDMASGGLLRNEHFKSMMEEVVWK